MNIDEYNKKIEEKYGKDKYKVYGEIKEIKCRDKILIECVKCGDIRELTAREFVRDLPITGKFLKKRECKNCQRIAKENKGRGKTTKLKFEDVQETLNPYFKLLEYENNRKVKVECCSCGNIYTGSLPNLQRAKSCSKCAKNRSRSIEDMNALLDEKYGSGIYKIISIENSNWESSPTHKVVEVLYHDKIFRKAFNELLKYGCQREYTRSFEYLNEILKEETNGRYKILSNGDYRTRKSKAMILDTHSDRVRERIIGNFLSNPTFGGSYSKNAITFFKELNSAHISFMKEKMFPETGRKRFDIETKKDKILVEIDGEQHFFPVFGSKDNRKESFQKTRNGDKQKNKFVKNSGKTLIRISYKNFEDIGKIRKIAADIQSLNFESLKSNPDILLIKDKIIFNENSYYGAVTGYENI